MWRPASLSVVVALVLGMIGSVAPLSAQSPADEAAQAGFPLLTEFTLRPGDQPFSYSYTAQADGPHRMVAAWGATIGLRLEVHGAGPDPVAGQGNPVSVPFAGKKGVEYTIRIGPAGNLPVASVGQLFGGLRRAQATVQVSGTLVQATPMPLPGPVAPGATPMPLPGPVPAAAMAKLTAPVDWAGVLQAVNAQPQMGQLLSSLPGGVAGTTQQVTDNVARVRAPTVPESSAALDWDAGLKFRCWSEPPAYYVNGQKLYAGALQAWDAELVPFAQLSAEQAKGIVRIIPGAYAGVGLSLEVPAEAATYAITVRMTDASGTLRSTWTSGDKPLVGLTIVRPWLPDGQRAQDLPLVMSTTPVGFSAIAAVIPPDAPMYTDSYCATLGMRKINLLLYLRYKTPTTSKGWEVPLLFGGIDIVRLN